MDLEFQTLLLNEIFPPSINPFNLRMGLFEAGEIYPPGTTPIGLRFGVFDSSVVYGVNPSSVVGVGFDVLNAGEIYAAGVFQNDVSVAFTTLELGRIISPRISIGEVLPLRFKQASSRTGGPISDNDLAVGSRGYLSVNQVSNYDSPSDFSYNRVSNLVDEYVPSFEAVFSRTYYSGFYIENESHLHRENIDFWINGGGSYRMVTNTVNKTMYESEHIYDSEAALVGDIDFFENEKDRYVMGGVSRTSLFGHLDVSYFVASGDSLQQFSDNGVGTAINLSSRTFTPGTQKTRIRNLGPGESVGIYLKVTTKFSIDFPVQRDYSFLHLSYKSVESDSYETLPGQVRSPSSNYTALLIPSVYFSVRTDYDRLKDSIQNETRVLYDKYPPYFLAYEDG